MSDVNNKFENRVFFKGQMSLDLSPEYQENGTYGRAYNIRPYNTESGSIGTLTNVEGNEQIPYTFEGVDDAGFLRCIGSVRDLKRNRVYWLVYGQTRGTDQYAYVLYYSYDTQDITTVFSGENALELDPDYPVDQIDIIYDDEVGDTLFWTDTNSEPKELNITAGVNRFNNYTVNTSGFETGDIVFADTEEDTTNALLMIPCVCSSDTNDFPSYNYSTGELDSADWSIMNINECYPPFLVNSLFYRKPVTPNYSPNATFEYETGGETNEGAAANLRRSSFQFRYQYVYAWGQVSEWSPISEACFSQELTSGIYAQGGSSVNANYPTPKSVKVRVPISTIRATGTDVEEINYFPHAMISAVNIAVREVPESLAPNDWYLWEKIPFSEFYKYDVSDSQISDGFPPLDDAGTYFYNWDTFSFLTNPSTDNRVIHLTVNYDGSQTLTPIDIAQTSENYFRVGKKVKTQTVVDNRIIDGGITDGMDVSLDVLKSFEEDVRLTANEYDVNFDVSLEDTPINEWISGATFTQIINSDRDAEIQFTLGEALGDYNQTFYYSFTINISFTYRTNALFDPSQTATFNYNVDVSGQSQGIPTEYNTFEEFLEDVVLEASSSYINQGDIRLETVSVDNATGQLTLSFNTSNIVSILFDSIDTNFITPVSSQDTPHFYSFVGYLPERTFKNHSTQQFGVAFSDEAGRLSQVVTGDWGSVNIPHFISDDQGSGDYLARKYKVEISGLEDVTVPLDATTAHVVRKVSPSYSNFLQCAISETNTVTESWNWDKDWVIGYVNLEADENNGQTESNTAKLYVSLNAANGGDGAAYESVFNTIISDFNPQEGDILRFLYRMDSDGEIVERYNSAFNILNYSELWNTVVLEFDDVTQNEPELATYLLENEDSTLASGQRILFEVIKKPTVSEQELYWEVAAQLSCRNGSMNIVDSRSGLLLYGDTYLKLRGYCIDFTGNTTTPNVYQNFILQDKNYNDFFASANDGLGRPNQYSPSSTQRDKIYSEIERDNIMRYSEVSIQNTDVRNYGTVYSSNLAEQDNIFGRIEHIVGEGDKLDIYQEDKISYRFVGRGITTELSGDTRAIATQNNVLSDPIYNASSYGISQDSTSFAKSGYRKYFTDRKRGMVYRQSNDGITPISEVGMSGYFKDVFREVRNSFTTPVIRGIVDERTDEYILSITYSKDVDVEVLTGTPLEFTFGRPEEGVDYTAFRDDEIILIDTTQGDKYAPTEFTAVGNQDSDGIVTVQQKPTGDDPEAGDIITVSYPVNVTLVFSERTGGWTTFLGYTAEWLSSGIQSYHSFFNGQMWLHDIGNTDYNTFFDIPQDSYVDVYSNVDPIQTKYWLTVGVKTNSSTTQISEGEIETSEEQVSYIPNADFINKEGTKWASFYGEGTGTEVLSGDRLRGRWLKARIRFGEYEINEERLKLYAILYNSKQSGFSV